MANMVNKNNGISKEMVEAVEERDRVMDAMKPKPHVYKLKYDLKTEAGEFTAEEIKKSGSGGTDAFLMFSCLYPLDGSLSTMHTSFDGRFGGKEMSSKEVFKMWMLLGKKLSQDPTLDEFRRELAEMPSDMFFKLISEKK